MQNWLGLWKREGDPTVHAICYNPKSSVSTKHFKDSEPICSAAADTQTEQTCGHVWGSGGGEGRLKGETSKETYALPYIK